MPSTVELADRDAIQAAVSSAVAAQPITDPHTHSYPPTFGAAPDPECSGNANGDDDVNVGDAVYLIAYVFKMGPGPATDCCR